MHLVSGVVFSVISEYLNEVNEEDQYKENPKNEKIILVRKDVVVYEQGRDHPTLLLRRKLKQRNSALTAVLHFIGILLHTTC